MNPMSGYMSKLMDRILGYGWWSPKFGITKGWWSTHHPRLLWYPERFD